ncbi:Psilocybin biosynthesis kinase [Hyphodiscus hymeniophilus]|uniref:Psilocybin biosynthesis kinase n=1 Tax=Hyphodiscus hymeniophilus TaxID=353542 RepID=A0A9P6VJP7_9HELO|nr:Psilocybin biosynthesis kinase [Hyphodiscus hymeniophilus]
MEATENISAKVLDSLRHGPYACTSLDRLSGGTANFVYRGTLTRALEDGTRTVVIKHTEGYVASNPGFKLTTSRSDYEQIILSALDQLQATTNQGVTITTPHLFLFSQDTNTQVYSDIPTSTELKTYTLTHALTQAQCRRLGYVLGSWTRNFHTWAAAPEQAGLRKKMEGNDAMRELKYMINYTNLVGTVERFPEILGRSKEVFEAVAERTRGELDTERGSLIHGDFWSGNVLLPNTPFPPPTEPLTVFVIDWEMAQLSSIAFDLGQMFAELFELKHFKDVDAGVWLIESFVEGYGKIDEELAFKTAIHAGAHLICWGSRVAGWGTREQVETVVEIGRDWVVRGWERDAVYFQGTASKHLFA